MIGVGMLGSCQIVPEEESNEKRIMKDITAICNWRDDKQAALTLTYDDGIIYGLAQFETLHIKYGLKGTIGVVPTWTEAGEDTDGTNIASWEELSQFVGRGTYDICSHSYSHRQGTILSVEALRDEYGRGITAVEENMGLTPTTLIYPYYDFVSRMGEVASEYFIAARGGDADEDLQGSPRQLMNVPGATNYYDLFAYSFYIDTTFEDMEGDLDANIDEAAWFICCLHSCNGDGWEPPSLDLVDEVYGYFASRLDVVWNGFFEEVAKYYRERQDAHVVTTIDSETQITVSLTFQTINQDVFNYPLTLKTPISNDWVSVQALQGDESLAVTLETIDSKKYALYNAIPGGGAIVLSAAL